MRIAIVCPGIGECQRGYERYFGDLFEVLRGHLDVTLFKGGGPTSATEQVVPFLRRNGSISRIFPIHRLFGRTSYHTEGLTYALGLHKRLRSADYDIVHTIDPPLAKILYQVRERFGGRYRLVFTNGCELPPVFYPGSEHVHHVGRVAYDDALAFGLPIDRLSLIPCGIHSADFRNDLGRDALRAKHGIPPDAFVILSVAAINRRQKRIDYLIDEVARLEQDVILWVDGSLDRADVNPELIPYGRERLGERFRYSNVPTAQIPELYGLADVKVLTSTNEAFALAVVEAMAAGCPVIAHDNPHFNWLLETPDHLVDMRRTGALAERLDSLISDRDGIARLANPERVRRRFDWDALRDDYIDMYRQVAEKSK